MQSLHEMYKEPEIGAREALEVSKNRTGGYKLKMFACDVIWVAAAGIILLILGALSKIRGIGFIFSIVMFLAEIALVAFGHLIGGLIKSAYYVEINRHIEGSDYYENTVKTEERGGKFCHVCGAPMREEDSFCANCGSKYDSCEKDGYAEESGSSETEEEVVKEAVQEEKTETEEIIKNAEELIEDIKAEAQESIEEKTEKTGRQTSYINSG